MWGEDEIDDVLEKLKFEDALKEICRNQGKTFAKSNRDSTIVNRY